MVYYSCFTKHPFTFWYKKDKIKIGKAIHRQRGVFCVRVCATQDNLCDSIAHSIICQKLPSLGKEELFISVSHLGLMYVPLPPPHPSAQDNICPFMFSV